MSTPVLPPLLVLASAPASVLVLAREPILALAPVPAPAPQLHAYKVLM